MSQIILVFDGACVLCSGAAQFVLKHDHRERFLFAAMQAPVGADLLRETGLDPADPASFLFIDGKQIRQNSDAIIAVLERLGWPWRAASILRAVPAPLRDIGYRWIARNRYRLSGRRDQCFVPQPSWRDRML